MSLDNIKILGRSGEAINLRNDVYKETEQWFKLAIRCGIFTSCTHMYLFAMVKCLF